MSKSESEAVLRERLAAAGDRRDWAECGAIEAELEALGSPSEKAQRVRVTVVDSLARTLSAIEPLESAETEAEVLILALIVIGAPHAARGALEALGEDDL